MPTVAIAPHAQPNAFATGRNPEHAVVCVTQGLLETVNQTELEGVIAHELAHIQHRDMLLMTVTATLAAAISHLAYVALFPSTIAYLCFNRGVQLIGANRAAPFFHVVPVFGTVMSIAFLGEHPQAFQFIGFALVLTGVFVASRKASA